MSQELVKKVLATEVNTFATTNNLSIAWENIPFEPDTVDEYLEFYIMFSNPDNGFLVSGDRIIGVMQLNIYTPLNQGDGRAWQISTLIKNYFNDKNFNNQILNYKVYTDNMITKDGINTDNKYKKIVELQFQAWRD